MGYACDAVAGSRRPRGWRRQCRGGSTGEIGALAVGKIENKGRQNRRVNIALA
jgi:hypothetical protein